MSVDPLFWLAVATFAWGLSLASYRWFAIHNGWPMGEWQAHRPGLPIAIGLLAVVFALFFAAARGGDTLLVVPLLGLVGAMAWTAVMRVGAQSALLLAPLAMIGLLVMWMTAAARLDMSTSNRSMRYSPYAGGALAPAATERERDTADRDRGITPSVPRLPVPPSR